MVNPDIVKYLQNIKSVDNVEWLCNTCSNHLKKCKVPPCAIANGMKFPEKPAFFDLNELECRLIAPRLAFQKIFQAPRGGQLKITGNEIHHLLNKKETARRKAKLKSSSHSLWENFRHLRRSCKSLITRKRKEFFQSLPGVMKSNKKRFWSLFKSVSSSSSVPSKITWKRDDGTVTATNPEETANILNNYFYSMFNHPFPKKITMLIQSRTQHPAIH